ncbi:ABC transporter substrate-binding protein [Aestuariimicrobium sp. T2.26MG-19.2B]|uniref:ABC transporter substrate-binding protein n=1 Tax=Aestuariimicrobium sp. T2.26MG-19.2B TaxID=3040679 RepID=UPI00247754B7|nr:extracellular solute-binding protein [Aestuariimicrobium sp. T2.26MG-19.2B]CAI9400854.1 hypothetical protein AESSP_00475 [Aestuariimicrobium sp. T2.26MG-19.2B]
MTISEISRRAVLGGLGIGATAGLVGCSNDNGSSQSTPTVSPGSSDQPIEGAKELTVYCWSNGPTIDDNFKKRVALFNEQYKGRFTAKMNFLPYDQYWQKAQLQYAAGKPFDIYYWDVQAYAHYKKNLVENVQPVINTTALADTTKFPSALFDPWRFDGKNLYAVPENIQSMSLFYNKDHFDAAGLKYPDETWSWDDVVTAAGKLKKTSGSKVTQWGLDIGTLGVWWGLQSLSWAAGSSWVDKALEPTKFQMTDPATIEAMKFTQDLMWDKHIAPRPEERNALNQAGANFSSGAISMMCDGTWAISGYQQMKAKWDMTAIPLWKGKRVAPYWLGGWVIPKKTAAKTAAETFATWSATTFQPQMAKNHDWIPISNEARSSKDMLAGMPAGFASAFKDIENAKIGDIYTANMQEIFNQVFGVNLDDLYFNRKTPEQVAQKIQEMATAKL